MKAPKEENKEKAKKTIDKKTRNIILIITGSILLVALTITAILVINHITAVRLEKEMREKPVKIAFYKVDKKSQEAIKKVISKEWDAAATGISYEFATLDSSKSAEDHLFDDYSIGLLFSDSYTAEAVSNLAIKPSESIYNGMPYSVRGITKTSAPILLDDFETLYNISLLSKNGMSPVATLEEMLDLVKVEGGNKRFSLGCPGKDDKTLGMFVSSLMEALYSDKSLEILKKTIQNAEKASDTANIFDTVLQAEGNEAFKSTLDLLCQWKKSGLLHSEWYNMTQEETNYLMETSIFSIVFLPLSMHRNVPYRTIEKYTESYFPVAETNQQENSRSLVFSILTGTVIKNRYDDKIAASMAMLEKLLTLENQAFIAEATGLAPVSATAESPDRQASNARLWAAASDKPLTGLNDFFTKPAAKTEFFKGLRNYLKIY